MTYLSGPAVNTLLLSTVTPSVSTAEVPVTVILPKALSMTLVTRTCNKMHGQSSYHQHLHLTLRKLFIQLFFSQGACKLNQREGLTCRTSATYTEHAYIYTFQALFWEIEVSLTKYTLLPNASQG